MAKDTLAQATKEPVEPVYSRYLDPSSSNLALLGRLAKEKIPSVNQAVLLRPGEVKGVPLLGHLVVFASQFDTVLRIPAVGLLKDMLDYFGLEVSHLDPSAILRLSVFEWALQSNGATGSAELFAFLH